MIKPWAPVVIIGVRSGLHPFQGRLQCNAQHSFKCTFNKLASTTVTDALNLAMTSLIASKGQYKYAPSGVPTGNNP
jgi:hypothetical protein